MSDVRMCDFCGKEPADARYREVKGIEELRDQGGANKIIGRTETGLIPCWTCVRKKRDGLPPDQGTLI